MSLASNVPQLPQEVREYSRLVFQKKALNRDVAKINARLKSLEPVIIEHMSNEDLDAYEICPNQDEEPVFGGIGAIQLKSRNEYERLSKENLTRILIQFFRYLMPSGDDLDVTRLGCGTANWIWNNRGKEPKRWLNRIYLEEEDQKERSRKESKRRTLEPSGGIEPAKKKVRPAPMKNVPSTREEFLSTPAFSQILSCQVLQEEPSHEDIL